MQRFLEAAFELIDEKGTTEFTIQEVVDRSKQSLRSFYEYFDGDNARGCGASHQTGWTALVTLLDHLEG